MAWLCGSEQLGLAWTKSLIAFRSAAPGNSQHCHPAWPRLGHSLPTHSLPAGMLKEKNKIDLIGFLFASQLPASLPGKAEAKVLETGRTTLSKCESWFHHISINLLFKCTENSFVHWLKQSNYCSPQLKGRSGNGCWLFFSFICFCEWLLRTAGLSGFMWEHIKNLWNTEVFGFVLLK